MYLKYDTECAEQGMIQPYIALYATSGKPLGVSR